MDFRAVTLTRELVDAISRNAGVTTDMASRIAAVHGNDFMPGSGQSKAEDEA